MLFMENGITWFEDPKRMLLEKWLKKNFVDASTNFRVVMLRSSWLTEMVIKTSIEGQVIPNQTLRGFDKIDSIKEELEKACPEVGQHSFIFQQTPNHRRLGLFDFSIPCHVCSLIFFK